MLDRSLTRSFAGEHKAAGPLVLLIPFGRWEQPKLRRTRLAIRQMPYKVRNCWALWPPSLICYDVRPLGNNLWVDGFINTTIW
jgi:hypothetical protein